ncbi:MAG: lytic transglycosylase domain-containing protein [Dactylosporangium sp.]|nr:lytic transglycosylase domain-containing protein [Dactylosporangium sp.]NNJ61948.1 lytic transglycosylase domain-containing protein [Dactylosporangium sp.]
MIRLWNRIGIFRSLSIAMLVSGLIGGLLLASREAQHDFTSTTATVAGDTDAVRQLEQDLADRQNAQGKADQLAATDAERAKAADDQARKNEAASRAESRTTKSGVTAGPVPESCSSYSGNKAVGCTLMVKAGYPIAQMPCLDKLWTKESGWRTTASNPSGAYGIPQANPGSKMAAYGSDWKTSAATQVSWGLNYIKGRYSTPCGAWSSFQSKGWY